MTATSLLESVRNAAQHVRSRTSNKSNPDNNNSSSHADSNATETESEDPDGFEHVQREQSYDHISHSDAHDHNHTQDATNPTPASKPQHSDSIPSYIEAFEQNQRPLTPHEIAQGTDRKQLGGSTDLKITDFDLLKTLGTGTFARVWLAKLKKGSDHTDRQRVFALKVLRKADVVRLKQVEHVQNERTTLAAAAGHPFITTLILTFRDPEAVYLLLDYCPGGELFAYLRRKKTFDEPAAKFYAAEITLVFEFLHEMQGIAYRDLKPENILLDQWGHIKLVDFGFAKKLSKQETYTLCGTPEYLAPEVIKNTGHGVGTDWWALGILIYEFLVGQPPFVDQNPMKAYQLIVECKLRFPSNSKMSDEAKDIISSLIQLQPSRRLGCMNGGARTVKEHPWFACVNWEDLYSRKMDGPIIPKILHAEDSANFDTYPDEDLKERRPYTDRMRKQWDAAFADF